MKCKTINVTLTVNLGNYESLRIGGEWELEPGETEGRQIVKTYEALRKTAKLAVGLGLEPKSQVTDAKSK